MSQIKQKLLQKFCEFRNRLLNLDKKKSPNCFQAVNKNALEERWGLWVALNLRDQTEINEIEIQQKFENFSKRMENLINTKYYYLEKLNEDKKRYNYYGQLNNNPYFFVFLGNHFAKKSNYRDAILCYQQAMALDDDFSAFARYNLAYTYLKENRIKNQTKALKQLQRARSIFNDTNKNNITQIHQLIQIANQNQNISTQYRSNLDIISSFEYYLEEAIKMLQKNIKEVDNAKNDGIIKTILNNWNAKTKGTISHIKPLNEIFFHCISNYKSTKNNNNQYNLNLFSQSFKYEIKFLKERGCLGFLVLSPLKPIPWAKSIVLVSIAGAQAYAGYLVTTCSLGVGAKIGQMLVQNAIGDLISVGQGLWYRDIDLTNYFTNKAISFTASAITFGCLSSGDAIGSSQFFSSTISDAVINEGKKIFIEKACISFKKQALNLLFSTLISQLLPYIIDIFYNDEATEQLVIKALKSKNILKNAISIDTNLDSNYWYNKIYQKGTTLCERGYGTINIEKFINQKSAEIIQNSNKNKQNSKNENWTETLFKVLKKFGINTPKSLLRNWMRDNNGWLNSSNKTQCENSWYVASYLIDLLEITLLNFKNPPSVNHFMDVLSCHIKNEHQNRIVISSDQQINIELFNQNMQKLSKQLSKHYNTKRKQIIKSTLERLASIGINEIIDQRYKEDERLLQQRFKNYQSARRNDLLKDGIKFTDYQKKIIDNEQIKLTNDTKEKSKEKLLNQIKEGRATKDTFDVMAKKHKFHAIIKDKNGNILFEVGTEFKNKGTNIIEYDPSGFGHYKIKDTSKKETQKSIIDDMKQEDSIMDNMINLNYADIINSKKDFNQNNKYKNNIFSRGNFLKTNFLLEKENQNKLFENYAENKIFNNSPSFIQDNQEKLNNLKGNYLFESYKSANNIYQFLNIEPNIKVSYKNGDFVIEKPETHLDTKNFFENHFKQIEEENHLKILKDSQNCAYNVIGQIVDKDGKNIKQDYLEHVKSHMDRYEILARDINYLRSINDPSLYLGAGIPRYIITRLTYGIDTLIWCVDHPITQQTIRTIGLLIKIGVITTGIIGGGVTGSITGPVGAIGGAIKGGAEAYLAMKEAEIVSKLADNAYEEVIGLLIEVYGDQFDNLIVDMCQKLDNDITKEEALAFSKSIKNLGYKIGKIGTQILAHKAYQSAKNNICPKPKIDTPRQRPKKNCPNTTHPNGVKYDKNGFPKFKEEHLYKPKNPTEKNTVNINFNQKYKMIEENGFKKYIFDEAKNRYLDVKEANLKAGFSNTPKGYRWHHHENGTTMQLVKENVHKMNHTGGFAIKQYQNETMKVIYQKADPFIKTSASIQGIAEVEENKSEENFDDKFINDRNQYQYVDYHTIIINNLKNNNMINFDKENDKDSKTELQYDIKFKLNEDFDDNDYSDSDEKENR